MPALEPAALGDVEGDPLRHRITSGERRPFPAIGRPRLASITAPFIVPTHVLAPGQALPAASTKLHIPPGLDLPGPGQVATRLSDP
jgi:hypothetical protein